MSKANDAAKKPATRVYVVKRQIEVEGVTYPAGSYAELTEDAAASVGDCVSPRDTEPSAAA